MSHLVIFLWSCSRASDFGLMKIDETGRIHQFYEKPKGEGLKAMVATLALILTHAYYNWKKLVCNIKLIGVEIFSYAASGHNRSGIVCPGCKEISLHCINGDIFVQNRCSTKPFKVNFLVVLSSGPELAPLKLCISLVSWMSKRQNGCYTLIYPRKKKRIYFPSYSQW